MSTNIRQILAGRCMCLTHVFIQIMELLNRQNVGKTGKNKKNIFTQLMDLIGLILQDDIRGGN